MLLVILILVVAETAWALLCAYTGINILVFYAVLVIASVVFWIPGLTETRASGATGAHRRGRGIQRISGTLAREIFARVSAVLHGNGSRGLGGPRDNGLGLQHVRLEPLSTLTSRRLGARLHPSSRFMRPQSLSIFLLLLGSYLTYEYLSRRPSASPASSLFAIIGSAISDRRLRRTAFFAALLYGLLYAFTSSILVFQPGVDFGAQYGATTVGGWSSSPCCGDVGTLPKLVIYLPPAI